MDEPLGLPSGVSVLVTRSMLNSSRFAGSCVERSSPRSGSDTAGLPASSGEQIRLSIPAETYSSPVLIRMSPSMS